MSATGVTDSPVMPAPTIEAPHHHSVGYNLVWGAIFGVRVGFFFVILATLTRVFGGADVFRSWGSTYFLDVVIDMCGGVAGGLVVGLLRPFITSAKAAALVGFLALLPVAVLANVEDSGLRGFASDEVYGALLYALLIGPAVGALVWFRVQDRSRQTKH